MQEKLQEDTGNGVEWRVIPGIRQYEVSNTGRVRRCVKGMGTRVGRERKIIRHSNGYSRILLYHDGRETGHWVHRLVAAAFLGPCPDGLIVHHKDNDPANNHVDNLEYTTYKGNSQAALKVKQAKLTEDVRRWRERQARERAA